MPSASASYTSSSLPDPIIMGVSSVKSKSRESCPAWSCQAVSMSGMMVSYTPGVLGSVTRTGTACIVPWFSWRDTPR